MYSIATYVLVLGALSTDVSAKIETLIKIGWDFVTIFDNTSLSRTDEFNFRFISGAEE